MLPSLCSRPALPSYCEDHTVGIVDYHPDHLPFYTTITSPYRCLHATVLYALLSMLLSHPHCPPIHTPSHPSCLPIYTPIFCYCSCFPPIHDIVLCYCLVKLHASRPNATTLHNSFTLMLPPHPHATISHPMHPIYHQTTI